MRSKEVEEAIGIIYININADKKELKRALENEIPEHKIAYLNKEITLFETVLSYISELEKDSLHWRGKYHLLTREINVIPKDKIRDKIKELEDRIKQLHPASDCVIIDDLENQIQVLKELLEGE